MPKTISWDKQFEDEALMEPTTSIKIAIRPGRLYFDNDYYQKGDVVDIRVDNIVVRKAMIHDEMKLTTIKDLSPFDINLLKTELKDKEVLKDYLSKKYKTTVDDDTEITVITYSNMNLIHSKENIDPHFC